MSGMGPSYGPALARVRAVRRGSDGVLLEGVHALKHASRFGARVEVALTPDRSGLTRLLRDLAPDVTPPEVLTEVDATTWRTATAGRELPSPSLAVADRPAVTPDDVLAGRGRIVVLEQPRHLGNLGAVVRVAAAAGAGGVLIVGAADPWHPTAVRAAAGLQFALPVARCDELPPVADRPVVALDADPDAAAANEDGRGTALAAGRGLPVAEDAVVLFGTERGGLTPALRSRAAATAAIPMRPGVSSLNLATAVAVVLYAGRFGPPAGRFGPPADRDAHGDTDAHGDIDAHVDTDAVPDAGAGYGAAHDREDAR